MRYNLGTGIVAGITYSLWSSISVRVLLENDSLATKCQGCLHSHMIFGTHIGCFVIIPDGHHRCTATKVPETLVTLVILRHAEAIVLQRDLFPFRHGLCFALRNIGSITNILSVFVLGRIEFQVHCVNALCECIEQDLTQVN